MEYRTIRRIGRGGMGVVDLGEDEAGNQVALKRLSLHGTPEELATARQRIRREAEVLQHLEHPGIVRLRDVVDDGDDIVLVMDYLAGGNLAQKVADLGPLPADEVVRLADGLLEALATAHRQGVVHRDIKPANVLFDDDGNPSLADFGVALHRDATPGLTATSAAIGTPGFMAPEQARGETATAASDVFSLGATLLFAATGAGPFGTGDPRVLMLRAAAGKTEKAPKTLPTPMRRGLDAMMAADPGRRPTAAAARGGSDGTRPRTAPRVARRPTRRMLYTGVGVVLLLVALVLGVVAVVTGRDGDRSEAVATSAPPASFAATTTEACVPLPYQPCGEEPAPNTDGEACDAGFADYDDDPTTGCEAVPDDFAERALLRSSIEANLVPADDADTYTLEVGDGIQLICDGELKVTLTAPRGVSQRITVLEGQEELGTAVSGDGDPATVRVGDPNCLTNDATTLLVKVESIGSDRSPDDYLIEVRGSF